MRSTRRNRKQRHRQLLVLRRKTRTSAELARIREASRRRRGPRGPRPKQAPRWLGRYW